MEGRNINFGIKFQGETLYIDNGDLFFDVYDDDFLASVSYYGRVTYTEEEALKRVEKFKNFLGASIRPNSEKKIGAWGQVGDYGIQLSFKNSMNEEKPYVSRFSVFNRSGEYKSKIRERLLGNPDAKVLPPEGYEHLSLDPKVVHKEYYDQQAKDLIAYNAPEAKAERERKKKAKEELRQQAIEKTKLASKDSESKPKEK